MKKPRLGFFGAGGRMGREARDAIERAPFRDYFSGVDWCGRADGPGKMFAADVWLEFSSPEAALELCREAERRGTPKPFVVGATGWTEAQARELADFAAGMPILRASNFSVGIQACRALLRLWAERPETVDWRISMRESHHTGKKDAPSGTALSLAETIRESFGREVPIESVRAGDIFGIHEVVFESDSEKISLIHEAKSRAVFAEGALEAARRLAARVAGSEGGAELPKRLLSLDDLYLRRKA